MRSVAQQVQDIPRLRLLCRILAQQGWIGEKLLEILEYRDRFANPGLSSVGVSNAENGERGVFWATFVTW